MSKDTRKSPLAEWQIEDSKRLKALYAQKKAALNLTQEKMAQALGESTTQGAVSHFFNGRTALSLRAVSAFARALDVPVERISPELAKQINSLSPAQVLEPSRATVVDLGEAESEISLIPLYSARAAAGPGHENSFVERSSSLAFRKNWLRARGARSENLAIVHVQGDSMAPTIFDGDVILVDRSKVDPVHNKLFLLLSKQDGLAVKRLVLIEDMWVVRSDNEDKVTYPDRYLPDGERFELDIQGQVLWRGGDCN